MHLHGLRWAIDGFYDHDDAGWFNETRQHINRTRSTIAKEKHRLKKARASSFDANPAATIHRMLQSDALPSQLHVVIDSNGELTSNAEELEDVMVNHFESVFAIPPPDPVRVHSSTSLRVALEWRMISGQDGTPVRLLSKMHFISTLTDRLIRSPQPQHGRWC
jgi:hypothetical protein